jgi:hypothetical protein
MEFRFLGDDDIAHETDETLRSQMHPRYTPGAP